MIKAGAGPSLWACPAQTAGGLVNAPAVPSSALPAEALVFSPVKWGEGVVVAASTFLSERS